MQFTPDMLPADIVGTLIYNPRDGSFHTKHGPIFSNLVLADEINRAPAKVQSALLEAMQEHQVTIGDETYPLPEPFLVMATQNPIEQEGTYPLPEAQVDRFMLKLVVRLPEPQRGARDPRCHGAPATRISASTGRRARTIMPSAPRGQSHLRRRQGEGLHRRLSSARRATPTAYGLELSALHPVRCVAARHHQSDAGRAGLGVSPRPRLRHAAGCEDVGARRAAPSHTVSYEAEAEGVTSETVVQTHPRRPARPVRDGRTIRH